MSPPAVTIRLDGNGRVYRPGEELSGEYVFESVTPGDVGYSHETELAGGVTSAAPDGGFIVSAPLVCGFTGGLRSKCA